MNENLMRVEDFAVYWNLSRISVYRLVKRGLPSIKAPGVGRRILRREADAWLLAGGANRRRKAT